MNKPCISEHPDRDPAAELVVYSPSENLVEHIIDCVVQEIVPRKFKEEILHAES